MNDDSIPKRIGEIGNKAYSARGLAFPSHIACLSRKTPWDRLQQPQSVLLQHDQPVRAFDRFAWHLKRRRHVDREVGDNLLQAFGDCKQARHTGLLSGSFWI
jgi:hypothetical protein